MLFFSDHISPQIFEIFVFFSYFYYAEISGCLPPLPNKHSPNKHLLSAVPDAYILPKAMSPSLEFQINGSKCRSVQGYRLKKK